ncbi:MAG: LPS export ABC transporter ATP-binding protein [Planctomycetaceae bacterium]|jgi:lipopolysaccharide export system ATP-binding protein|nr:LPS export ABC transporter ATP-binding protein [Planctomycetaceae bacterium]
MHRHPFSNSSNLDINAIDIADHRTRPSNNAASQESASRVPIILRADGLVKIYGKRRVVDGVSFYVNKGEIVGLLGPNGAGKTTSFRMVCGLISSNGGIVHLGPHDITNWPMYRRSRDGGMGYLPQDKSVFQKLSVQNNLLAVMEMLGLRRQDRIASCNELLEKFKLVHLRRNMGGSLSGGEKRRLEIARALVSKPKIILLDEPFAAVDPLTVKSIQEIIRQLSNEGISVLITDHSVQDTLQITHRSYVIRAGQVLCQGTPEEVLSNADARESYFGDHVTVGQIQSTSLHTNNTNDTNNNENNNTKNNNIFFNNNNSHNSHHTNNFQNRPQSHDSDSTIIISEKRITDSHGTRSGVVKNRNSFEDPSTVILPNERNYSSRPQVIQKEINHRSRRIESGYEVENVQDETVTPHRVDMQSSILNNNTNSTRPATRRLVPSSSSVILPSNQFPAADRPPTNQTTQNHQSKQNSNPSASGIMRVLGAMFFGKNS